MNTVTTYEQYGQNMSNQSQRPSTRQTPPVAPFPRQSVYSVIDDVDQAEQAVQALQNAGYRAQNIQLFASEQFLATVEYKQHNFLSGILYRFFNTTDDGFFGDVYLYEARRGYHILVVLLSRIEQMDQVRDLLIPYRAHHIKYIGNWTVADLPYAVSVEGGRPISVQTVNA